MIPGSCADILIDTDIYCHEGYPQLSWCVCALVGLWCACVGLGPTAQALKLLLVGLFAHIKYTPSEVMNPFTTLSSCYQAELRVNPGLLQGALG